MFFRFIYLILMIDFYIILEHFVLANNAVYPHPHYVFELFARFCRIFSQASFIFWQLIGIASIAALTIIRIWFSFNSSPPLAVG